jgi:DNA-binding Lrp family transcriptional regulator
LDSIDAGIIRELSGPDGSYQWNVRHSYSAIAHKLGVDEETIRRRVRSLWRQGYIRGSELVINPYLLGREPVRVLLNVGNPQLSKKNVISQIKLIDGVLLIIDTLGEGLQVILFCENEETIARRTELVAAICQSKEDPWILRNLDALGFNRCKVKLSKTDLLVLKSLRTDPRKSTAKVASETGVSTRTVERRIHTLTEAGAFYHMFQLDFQKLNGVTASTTVSFRDEKTKRKLDPVISAKLEGLFYSKTSAKITSQFNFASKNVGETEEIYEWIRGLDGVVQARMGIIKQYILNSSWIDGEIDRMLSIA